MTYEQKIMDLREEINKVNVEIIEKIGERICIATEIASLKRKYNKPVVDKRRERAVLDQVKLLAREKGIDPDSVERVFSEIIRICVEAEERL